MFACKNQLRYSRERALQGEVHIFPEEAYISILSQPPDFEAQMQYTRYSMILIHSLEDYCEFAQPLCVVAMIKSMLYKSSSSVVVIVIVINIQYY